ncbi:MAG: rare lipoprotein [Gaiellales bacterium]|nr:rare lipoprotein [Gaiellales bacterium]
MPTDRQRMHPWACAVALPLVLLALAAAGPTGAAGSTLASKQSAAARVMATLDLLQTHRAAALQREQTAGMRLALARAAVAASRTQIAVDGHNLEVARAALAQSLVANYKAGGSDAVAYVLAAGSFSDLISRMDVLRRVASTDGDLIDQINRTQQLLQQQQQSLASAVAQAAAAATDAAQARRQLDGAIARSKAVLARVDASIRPQLAQERKRRSGLASKDGGGTTTTTTGGSGDSGGSGGSSNVFYGDCTWYGPGFAGHRTADGEIFDPTKLTAASPWLPFNTELKVTNLATGLSVQVRVNDRGPFGHGVLDLSAHAAQVVHLSGWQRVRIQILPSAAARPMFTL